MNTDPIADYLTRIRNANNAKHRIVEIPASNMKKPFSKRIFVMAFFMFEAGISTILCLALFALRMRVR